MENESEFTEAGSLINHPHSALIDAFCEITACASKSEALFFLESHHFDLDAAVSTFLDDEAEPPAAAAGAASDDPNLPAPQSNSHYSPSESSSPSHSPSRSRPLSPPPAARSYDLRSSVKRKIEVSESGARKRCGGVADGGIRTLGDVIEKPEGDDSDSDPDFDPEECDTGVEKSGMFAQDSSRAKVVDEIFEQARRNNLDLAGKSGAVRGSSEHHLPSSDSSSFTGTARLLAVSSTPQQPGHVSHNVTLWRNGFTVDGGPLRRFDDPKNASFMESIRNSECPKELDKKRIGARVYLTRKEECYKEQEKRHQSFPGVGRTIGSTDSVKPSEPDTVPTALTATPSPSPVLIVDQTQPSTSIQVRLLDGTRLVSRFNNNHTIRDIRDVIDASRPDGMRTYRLQTMGFPPKQLSDLDQTIDQAGIANSVVVQRL